MKIVSSFLGLMLCSFLILTSEKEGHASIQLDASIDGGITWTTVASGTSFGTSTHGIFAGGGWNLQGTLQAFDGPPLSELSKNTLSLEYNGVAASANIVIRASATDHTFPSSPPDARMTTTIAGTFSVPRPGGTTSISYQTWASPENVLFDRLHPDAITSGLLGVPGLDSVVQGTQFVGNQNVITGALDAPFNSTQYVWVTLDKGERLNFTVTQTLSAVPEPASMAVWSLLACVGAAGVAVRRSRRGRWTNANRDQIIGVIGKN